MADLNTDVRYIKGIGEAKATVNGQVAATAELTFALGKDS